MASVHDTGLAPAERKARKKAADAAYYQKHREERKAAAHAYYHANKDAIRPKATVRNAAYRAAKINEIRARDAAYRAANREKVRASYEAWKQSHPGVEKARARAWYQANKSKVACQRKKRYRDNAERVKAQGKRYYTENPHVFSKARAKRRALEANASIENLEEIARWEKEWRKKDCVKCHWCCGEFPGRICHAGHVVPLSKGGAHAISNLVASCPHCNLSKGSKLPHEFAPESPFPRHSSDL